MMASAFSVSPKFSCEIQVVLIAFLSSSLTFLREEGGNDLVGHKRICVEFGIIGRNLIKELAIRQCDSFNQQRSKVRIALIPFNRHLFEDSPNTYK